MTGRDDAEANLLVRRNGHGALKTEAATATREEYLRGFAIKKLFFELHGRDANSVPEAVDWINAQKWTKGQPDPYEVFTPDEIAEIDKLWSSGAK